MSLVGELLISARELMTDLPPTLVSPIAANITVTPVTVAGGALGASAYYLQVTFWNNFGETAPSTEIGPITITGPNNALQVVCIPPPGNVKLRVYFGNNGSGSEVYYQEFAVGTGLITVQVTGFSFSGSPPLRSSAYLPDANGPSLSVSALYRWLNQSLAWAAAKNRGGLPDFGAVGTTGGVGNYVMNGYWKKIDNGWYDGYPMGLLNKNNVFRRNPVTGYSGSLTIFQATDRLMVELWPQPSRTSAQTVLQLNAAATDTTITLLSAANVVLGFGLFQLGSEIIYYAAVSGNQLTGCLRGMCGTTPAAWIAGTSATELNLLVSGFRVPSGYPIGSSLSTLFLPPGWDEALVSYMIYRFRKAEQDEKGAQAALGEATQKMSDLSANRIIAGPRQIQPWGSHGPEIAVGLGSPFGGVIIP